MTLLYDASCPVCALEMDHLRERNRHGRLAFVDIAAPGFDAAAWGTTLAALDAQIHGFRPDGTVLIGLPALREAYAAVGLGWVLRATAWAPLAPLADAGYRVFARHRQAISSAAAPLIGALRELRELREGRARRTLARMARCRGGACAIDNPQPGDPR
jgi:predicted DCC family thiol-disulfide oxidoreductase YuxK